VSKIVRVALLLAAILVSPGLFAQEAPTEAHREYPFPVTNIQAALQQMGAYRGARLPTLDGFIRPLHTQFAPYQRPYYEYKIALEPQGNDKTVVRVKAKVSAWFTDPSGKDSGYQAFESNGRLESDLLDRLSDYLNDNRAIAGADAEQLKKEISDAHQHRIAAEEQVHQLEQQLAAMRDTGSNPAKSAAAYVSAARPRTGLVSAPEAKAPVILTTQPDDEFEVASRRGAWLQVKLDDGKMGWLRSSEVNGTPDANGGQVKVAAVTGFTVIREMASTFSGDWPRLKGKQALYVWARPVGSSLNLQADRKLPFAESVFLQRYQEAAHGAGTGVEGVVVIFLDQAGGVVAASLEDIRQWADGALSQQAFAAKCSLDPPSAFGMKQ
jgi:hypothetical protein